MMHYSQTNSEIKSNEIKLVLNGNSSLFFLMKLTVNPQMCELEAIVKEKWKKKIKRFRLFTSDGVELFEDDLQFLKPGRVFYVSRGEDFDEFSCFSEYDLLKKIGEGGFGKVYLGIHKVTQKKVAIKIINSGNTQDIEMVFREAETMLNLSHVNIVKIFNFYTIKNMQVAIIMEYLEGGELLKYLEEKGKIDENEAREFFIQLLNAISYCHNKKIIHRDLKLENILISDIKTKTIKVVDFGIASLCQNSNKDSLSAGTLKYMAPELFYKKSNNATSGIDVWAMGCILFALVTGKLPFSGESKKSIVDKIVGEHVKFSNDLSKELRDLLNKILEKDSRKRIGLGDIFHHPWVKKEFLMDEKENQELKEENKIMHSKKFSTDIPLLKKMSHEKRNSATTIKVMSSKENFDCLDQHKHYESLLRVSLNKKLETMSGGKNKV